jgi:hypothetical protein
MSGAMTLAGFAALLFWMALLVVMGYLNDWALARIFQSNRAHRLFVGVGVIVHEASHWAACVLTRTEVFEVEMFEESGGHVKHERRGPVVMAFIGLAPILGSSLFLMLLVWLFGTGGVRFAPSGVDLEDPAASFSGMLLSAGSTLWMNFSALSAATALFVLFLYLAWSVVACIAPSTPDLKHAFAGALMLALACVLVIYLQPLSFLGFGPTPALDFVGSRLANTIGIGLIMSFIPLAIGLPAAWARSR